MIELHPLTEFARGELATIAKSPVPALEVNAGVSTRLLRGGLVELVQLKSPYKSHKVRLCPHFKITALGLEELRLSSSPRSKRKRLS